MSILLFVWLPWMLGCSGPLERAETPQQDSTSTTGDPKTEPELDEIVEEHALHERVQYESTPRESESTGGGAGIASETTQTTPSARPESSDPIAVVGKEPELNSAEESQRKAEEQEELARAAIGPVRQKGTLEAWEGFARQFPATSFRKEAGQRIQALGSSDLVREMRQRFVEYWAESEEDDMIVYFLVDVVITPELEEGEFGAALLFKDTDYSYKGVNERRIYPSTLAMEQSVLRYMQPGEAYVLQFTEAALLSEKQRDRDQAVTDAWGQLTRARGLEFTDTLLSIKLPYDRMVPDMEAPGGRKQEGGDSQRFYLSSIFDGDQLISLMPRLPVHNRDWVDERLHAVRWLPGSRELELTRAICMARWGELGGRKDEALPIATSIFLGGHADTKVRGAQALARLDPTGKVFETLGALDDPELTAALYSAVQEDESIAANFQAEGAFTAATAAKTITRAELRGKLDVAVAAAERIRRSGMQDLEASDRIRVLVLTEDLPAIAAMGEEAIGPMLRVLGEDPSGKRGMTIQRALEEFAENHGRSKSLGELVRSDALVRNGLGKLPSALGLQIRPLFDDGVIEYLRMERTLDRMQELAGRDPSWLSTLDEWEKDAAGRPLAEYISEGKLRVYPAGSGIDKVTAKYRNTSDHPLRVVDPPGLQFAPKNTSVQNMVTRETLDVLVAYKAESKFSVGVACANRSRSIPGSNDEFTVTRVQSDTLSKVLELIEEKELSKGAAQAAVWILTDNATQGELAQLHRRQGTRSLGRLISDKEIVQAMHVVALAGGGIRFRAIWQAAPKLHRGTPMSPSWAWLNKEMARDE